jgi:hypothetical protein
VTWRGRRRRRRGAGGCGGAGCLGGHPNDTTNELKSQQVDASRAALNGHIDRIFSYHDAAHATSAKHACRTLITSFVTERARRWA